MSANPVKDPLEKEIEKKVCKYAESKGILQYKFVSPAHRGVPDRLFIMPKGSVFFIEFKRLGEKPTPGQLREHERMRKNNALVWVIDNIEDGKSVIDELYLIASTVQIKINETDY